MEGESLLLNGWRFVAQVHPTQKGIGDKIETEVILKRFNWISGMYGDSTILNFEDIKGRSLHWFSSSIDLDPDSGKNYWTDTELKLGMNLKIKGTVKNHTVYNGVNQTQLLRCKQI